MLPILASKQIYSKYLLLKQFSIWKILFEIVDAVIMCFDLYAIHAIEFVCKFWFEIIATTSILVDEQSILNGIALCISSNKKRRLQKNGRKNRNVVTTEMAREKAWHTKWDHIPPPPPRSPLSFCLNYRIC